MLNSVQENRDSRLGLAGDWKVNSHASWSTTGQNRTTGHTVILRLDLATQSSREAKPRASPVFEKPDVSHSSLTLVYIPLIPTNVRELPERILREKP